MCSIFDISLTSRKMPRLGLIYSDASAAGHALPQPQAFAAWPDLGDNGAGHASVHYVYGKKVRTNRAQRAPR